MITAPATAAEGLLASVLGRTGETRRRLAGSAGATLAHTQRSPFELAQRPALSTLAARLGLRVFFEVTAETGSDE